MARYQREMGRARLIVVFDEFPLLFGGIRDLAVIREFLDWLPGEFGEAFGGTLLIAPFETYTPM